MKVYVAGKAGAVAQLGARAVIDNVIEAGHKVTLDWTVYGNRTELGPRRAAELAQQMLAAVEEADVLVLARGQMPQPGQETVEPLGAYIEVGAALAMGKPVLALPGRTSLFWHLPQVQPVADLAILRQRLAELDK